MPDIHAKLSASSAHRWLNCPKSVKYNSGEWEKENKETEFAKEGTEAHSLAEQMLTLYKKGAFDELKKLNEKAKMANMDMQFYVNAYVEHILDLIDTEKLKGSYFEYHIEQIVNFDSYAPGGFGTADFLMVSKEVLYIRDLKYGKGVKVSIKDNPQLRLYALGALEEYDFIFDIKKINMGIIQPRLNSEEIEEISKEELLNWGKEVKKKAEIADRNGGDFNPGEHCKFCNIRSICKARTTDILVSLHNILKK